MKKVLAFVLVAGVLAGIVVIQSMHDNSARQAYAEANNCEWSATGSFYGDDRDFVCR